mmetsp:Transcript_36755/g.105933  ORF Transcript_36755/g.105933 Transcript_36755/m.105933 type:complete len:240 (-) Transcript_36755:140-859(-)
MRMMFALRASQRSAAPLWLSAHSFGPKPCAVMLHRAFASGAKDPPRVTDASRQPNVSKMPTRRPSSGGADPLFVPEVTQAQKQAAAVLKSADEAAAAAKKAAAEAGALATALKRVADEYALAKKKADEAAVAAHLAADRAVAAKRKADEEAVEVLKKAADEEKAFLKRAFQHFDTGKSGTITSQQLQAILTTLKLPANSGDVDDLMQIMDLKGWLNLMPIEMKEALRTHPSAQEWGNRS